MGVAVSMISLALGRTVPSSVAMAGELTLRGLVLPTKNVKEKILLARREKLRTIIIPEKNRS
jgi:ATP-dependent Lon protease